VEILFTDQFDQAYDKLPSESKARVQKAILMLGENPRYPGLQVKKMKGKDIWEARASKDLRLSFNMSGEELTLRNVGHHDDVLKHP